MPPPGGRLSTAPAGPGCLPCVPLYPSDLHCSDLADPYTVTDEVENATYDNASWLLDDRFSCGGVRTNGAIGVVGRARS
jgi:hypothetical protein